MAEVAQSRCIVERRDLGLLSPLGDHRFLPGRRLTLTLLFAPMVLTPVATGTFFRLIYDPAFGVLKAAVPGAVEARILNRAITIGGQALLKLRVGEDTLKVKGDPERLAGHGDRVYLSFPLEAVIFLRRGRRISHAAAFAD